MPARRGRPPLACQVFTIHITLNLRDGEDDDLLRFFTNLPPRRRAAALKVALRAGGMAEPVGESAVDDELSEAAASLLFG
jgi:hypothetical protein